MINYTHFHLDEKLLTVPQMLGEKLVFDEGTGGRVPGDNCAEPAGIQFLKKILRISMPMGHTIKIHTSGEKP